VAAGAPGLLALYGIGPETRRTAPGRRGHPEPLPCVAAWAHLRDIAPILASSSKRTRHRLNLAVTARTTTPYGGS